MCPRKSQNLNFILRGGIPTKHVIPYRLLVSPAARVGLGSSKTLRAIRAVYRVPQRNQRTMGESFGCFSLGQVWLSQVYHSIPFGQFVSICWVRRIRRLNISFCSVSPDVIRTSVWLWWFPLVQQLWSSAFWAWEIAVGGGSSAVPWQWLGTGWLLSCYVTWYLKHQRLGFSCGVLNGPEVPVGPVQLLHGWKFARMMLNLCNQISSIYIYIYT